MFNMKKLLVNIICLGIALTSFADVRLPSILTSNMVLQQQSSVKLWGWSAPAEKIYVTISWDNKTDSVVATRDANWQLNIQTPIAGGPFTITLRGNNKIVLENILIGEVWVCSGQSNMEMSERWGLPDVKAELPTAFNDSIRFFTISKATSTYPQDNCSGKWMVCDSNTLKTFSAAGYFFGKKLNKELNVPIGLINTSWGGTAAETWTPENIVNDDPELKNAAAKLAPAAWWPYKPSSVFNAMIAPVTNFSIAGTIWYQGESNTGTAGSYKKLFTAMIDAWRKSWNKDFPFYYVQIAPFNYANKNIAALLQEAQAKCMDHKNVGMIVIADLVSDVKNIHPVNKHDVGYRLANWALAETYHKSGIVYRSPVYKEMTIKKNKAVFSFDNVRTTLISKDKTVTELYIAGADKIFYPAQSKIEKDKLIVWSKVVTAPVAVRYAFGNTSIGNLFSSEGLPVTPFRTDNWQVDTSAYTLLTPSSSSNIKSKWLGFDRTDFGLAGRNCLVVEPLKAMSGKPWIWRTEFFGHEPQGDSALAAKGFHVAYIDMQDMYGSPASLDIMDKFYEYLTQEKKLNSKVVLEGFSRGGLFAFNWAARHPDKVSCIYVDAPVCDFKSWPGGKGKGVGSPADWEKLKTAYVFASDKEALEYKFNPVDNLEPLAKANIPILCVCGQTDDVVPMTENINIVEERFKKMGGKIKVMAKPNNGHHPHSLKDPTPIVEFILESGNTKASAKI